MLVWHYTIWLEEIVRDGVIRLATENVRDPRQHVVWFSKNQQWEGTVRKLNLRLGRHETFVEMAQAGILGRIGVEPGPGLVGWREYQRRSGIPRADARLLEEAARGWGANPHDWLASFSPVPNDQWRSVQVWRDHRWLTPG